MVSDEQILKLVMTKTSPEDLDSLKNLSVSSLWQVYRKILINMKEAMILQLLQEMDTNKAFDLKGKIAGINLCINQLPVMLAQDKWRQERAEQKQGTRQ